MPKKPTIHDLDRIEKTIDTTLSHEGGFVNDPADPGGATNFGITQQTLSDYLGRKATVADVKTLSVDLAREIYLTRYYFTPRLDTLPDGIECFLFDCAINHGPGNAIEFLQQVINKAGFGPVTVDGVLGPKSRIAAHAAHDKMGLTFLLNALVDERILFYQLIVRQKASQKKFLKGWIRRADSFWVDHKKLIRPSERPEFKEFFV